MYRAGAYVTRAGVRAGGKAPRRQQEASLAALSLGRRTETDGAPRRVKRRAGRRHVLTQTRRNGWTDNVEAYWCLPG